MTRTLDIGLVNNMPDSALKGTERQFGALLTGAADGFDVRLHLFSLPEIERSARARAHCAGTYGGLDDLLASRLDALIVTGAEPRAARLDEEPYWRSLAAVFEWAAANTASTLLSCLAAHAAALHFDGIVRTRLAHKRLGVFDHAAITGDPLTAEGPAVWRVAHSRWNELDETALAECGYRVLTRSPEAGAELFVKRHGGSLFVHCQGHPEYGPETLAREYQRDVRRFLTGEQKAYPTLPLGYFDARATEAAASFQARAEATRDPALLDAFPAALLTPGEPAAWGEAARSLYRNWLAVVAAETVPAREPALA